MSSLREAIQGEPLDAVISDIHANWHALLAVFKDMKRFNVTRRICLGDVVGYGPYPRECVRAVRKSCDVVLRGNHEEVVLDPEEERFLGSQTVALLRWARRKLAHPGRYDYLEYLRGRQAVYCDDRALYVHASPRDPVNEYLRPEYVHDTEFMESVFSCVPDIAFFGHTHNAGFFRQVGGQYYYTSALDLSGPVHLEPGTKYLINPGSVGMPRDGCPDPSYALFSGRTLWFRRVSYEINLTAEKLRSTDAPPEAVEGVVAALRKAR